MDQIWVQQKVSSDEPGFMSVEWDTFNVGTVEGDEYKCKYSCFTQEDCDHLLAALRWYDSFSAGVIKEQIESKKPSRKKVNNV
jgi:hypothetical protein